jgi:hypothetical protein
VKSKLANTQIGKTLLNKHSANATDWKHTEVFPYYCLSEQNWRLCLSSNSEARGGPIFLKILHNNLALIYIQFCPLENFSGHQRFFRSGIKKK